MTEVIVTPKRKYVRKSVENVPAAAVSIPIDTGKLDICEEMSLSEAVKLEIVVLKEDFDKLVAEAIASKKDDLRKEISNEQAAKKEASRLHTIEDFLKNTGLCDVEFGKRLLRLGIPRDYLTCLRDEHINLDDKALWAWIRNEYKPNKK